MILWGRRQEGKGKRRVYPYSLLLLLALSGCAPKAKGPAAVWVDVDRLTRLTAPARVAALPPAPPPGIPAKTAGLPARPPARLVAEAGIDGAVLAREVEDAQEASLARLRRRLSEVYRREADRFARAQLRELGDPYQNSLATLYPAYRQEFESYAERRAYPASRLAYVVGPRDPNPDDDPPDPNLTPLGKYMAQQASEARQRLKVLDAEFDAVIRELLARVDAAGNDAKAATFAAIEANRDALNRQALAEATLPMGPRGGEAIRLSLARAGIARVPAVPARSVSVPAVAAPSAAPRVESPKALVDARARLLGEARIWAAVSGFRLEKGGRNATPEFVRWRNMRAGASPNLPKPLAAP